MHVSHGAIFEMNEYFYFTHVLYFSPNVKYYKLLVLVYILCFKHCFYDATLQRVILYFKLHLFKKIYSNKQFLY